MSRRGMASEIPEMVYAFGPQPNAFMAVGILIKYFRCSCSSLSEDSAEFRYVPLYIADHPSILQVDPLLLLQELHTTPI